MPTTNRRKRRKISPKWKRWQSNCRTLRRLIKSFRDEPSPHGQKWSDKMIYHYTRKLEELKAAEPPKYLGS